MAITTIILTADIITMATGADACSYFTEPRISLKITSNQMDGQKGEWET